MRNKLIEVANTKEKILAETAGKSIACPTCGARLFSPFDKLYIRAYGECLDCTPEERVDRQAENIFEIL